MASRGQARVLEAIAAMVILVITAALLPIFFRSPTTGLQSQVEVGSEAYAYDVLGLLTSNTAFISDVYGGDWSAIYSLMNTVIGPQYNWYLAIIPYSKVLTTVPAQSSNYVALPITLVVQYGGYPPMPLTSLTQSRVSLNIYTLNQLLPSDYAINTTVPLSNVAFVQCPGTSTAMPTTWSNCKLINWWLESFDPRTGVAVVWLSTVGNVYMIISNNNSYPYNVVNNQYCENPYCYPTGGVSNLVDYTYKVNWNNEPSFINYPTTVQCNGQSQQLPAELTTNAYYGPYSASCTFIPPSSIYNNYVGFTTYMIGQLIDAIPQSSTSLVLSNGVVNLYSCTPSGCTQVGSVNLGNLAFTMLYGNTHEYLELTLNGQSLTSLQLPIYQYLYLVSLNLQPEPLLCALAINATLYDYVTTTTRSLNYVINLTNLGANCNGVNAMSASFSGIAITQNTPQDPIDGINYLYNMKSIIYDTWISPTPTSNYYMPVYINYSLTYLSNLNVIPPQYSIRIPTSTITPTATAMGIIQLPNGTYYLVILELMSLSG